MKKIPPAPLRMAQTVLSCMALASLAMPLASQAQTAWPSKPITLVVTYPPGGGADAMARLIAPKLGEALGQPVVIDNKPGASGQIGAAAVAKAVPDGHTLMFDASSFAVNPALYPRLPYDAEKAFRPVGVVALFPNVVLVNAKFPAQSIAELITAARANKDAVSFASSGNGSAQHLAGVLFESAAKVEMVHIPYKGGGPALNDVLGGQVPIMFDILASSLQNISAGKLRPIAVTTARRSPALPNVPTLAELGMTGFDFSAWHGIAVTAATPKPIVAKLNATLNAIFADPAVKKRWEEIGSPVIGGTPERFGSLILTESVRLGRIVKESGAAID